MGGASIADDGMGDADADGHYGEVVAAIDVLGPGQLDGGADALGNLLRLGRGYLPRRQNSHRFDCLIGFK